MSTVPRDSTLAGKRYVTLVMRVLIDARGRLLHGELVDAHGATQQRFAGWRGLRRAAQATLARQGLEPEPAAPAPELPASRV